MFFVHGLPETFKHSTDLDADGTVGIDPGTLEYAFQVFLDRLEEVLFCEREMSDLDHKRFSTRLRQHDQHSDLEQQLVFRAVIRFGCRLCNVLEVLL